MFRTNDWNKREPCYATNNIYNFYRLLGVWKKNTCTQPKEWTKETEKKRRNCLFICCSCYCLSSERQDTRRQQQQQHRPNETMRVRMKSGAWKQTAREIWLPATNERGERLRNRSLNGNSTRVSQEKRDTGLRCSKVFWTKGKQWAENSWHNRIRHIKERREWSHLTEEGRKTR